MLRATICAIAWSWRCAVLETVAPSRRSSASAARLKMASATSISMRVKPDSRGLDDDIDPAIRVDFDDYALVLPHKSDASGVDEAGRIECEDRKSKRLNSSN